MNPVLESLTPSTLSVSHLTPYFTAELRLISSQSREQSTPYSLNTPNYPQLKPNANEKIALLWNNFKRNTKRRVNWSKSWVIASGWREEVQCFPFEEGGIQRLHWCLELCCADKLSCWYQEVPRTHFSKEGVDVWTFCCFNVSSCVQRSAE